MLTSARVNRRRRRSGAPGTYVVAITVPGMAKPLSGDVKIDADP